MVTSEEPRWMELDTVALRLHLSSRFLLLFNGTPPLSTLPCDIFRNPRCPFLFCSVSTVYTFSPPFLRTTDNEQGEGSNRGTRSALAAHPRDSFAVTLRSPGWKLSDRVYSRGRESALREDPRLLSLLSRFFDAEPHHIVAI